MTVSPLNLPGLIAMEEVTVRFAASDIPASGHAVYRVVPTSIPRLEVPPRVEAATVLENEFLSVTVAESGVVSLHDLTSGWKTGNLFSFEDSLDMGDSYCFIPELEGKPFDLSGVKPTVEWVEKTELRQCIRLEYKFELPAEFDRETKQRSTERLENRVSLELSLQAGVPLLDLSGSVANASKDHRLRIWVHTGIDTDRNTSSQPFDSVERKRFPEQPDLKQDWTHPNDGWVSVSDEKLQMNVLTDGMYDYEHLPDARHSLAFTCVRSTGRILAVEFDLTTKEASPSPEWACPENQCLRTIPFHLAIRPGRISNAGLIREQQCWMTPLLTGYDSVDPHKFLEGRACLQDAEALTEMFYRDPPPSEMNIPFRAQGVALSESAAFSAYKRTEKRDGYVLRVYNPSSDTASVAVSGITSVREMTLAEVPMDETRPVEEEYNREISPKRIVTVEIE